MPNAAGIMFVKDGRTLLLKRHPGATDHPSTWAFAGGHIEDGETPEQAAVREAQEEVGVSVDPATLKQICDDGNFVTFIAPWPEDAQVVLNDEHTGHQWARQAECVGDDMHPGVTALFERDSTPRLFQMGQTETDVMRAIRDGELPSPQRFANMWLYAMRVTGTGVAVRHSGDEAVPDEVTYRPPQIYLTDEFLARCNGVPVIVLHPGEKNALDSEEFARRTVGTSAMPYIDGEDVWTIARIYDDEIGNLLNTVQLSTSPNVVFLDPGVNSTITLDDGTPVLYEGNPSLLDHLAICLNGVWDKGGEPSGVKSENLGATAMTEEERKAAADEQARKDADEKEAKEKEAAQAKKDAAGEEAPAWAKAFMDSMCARMDAIEGKGAQTPAEVAHVVRTDEEEAKAREALNARVDEVENAIRPLSDSEAEEMADAQGRADSAGNALGLAPAATRPLLGEKPGDYRRRMASQFKKHSPQWAGVDIKSLTDTQAFSIAEATIYNDAQAHAKKPSEVPAGQLREIKRADATGRQISTFVGDNSATWAPFQSEMRHVRRINKQQ